jgi:hypothetical protein
MKSFLSVITPMRVITKFLLAFPRNQHHQSCDLISTIKTSSFSSSSSIVSTRNTARRSKISYLHQPARPGTSFSTNRIFGRRSTTARLFSSVDHKQPNDDENTHHRNRNKNDNDNDSNTTRHKWLVVGDGDLSYSSTIAEELANKDIQLFATVLEEENDHRRIYERSKKNKEDILSHSSHHPNNNKQECDTTSSSSSSSQHQVLFGVDATRLEEYDFSTVTTKSTDATTCLTTKTDDNTNHSNINNDIKFQTIEFNFPHWSGKTNAKRNRQLLDEFLRSASKVLNNQNEKEEEEDDDDDVDSDNVSEIIISLCEGQGGFPALNGTHSQYSRYYL